MDNGVVLKLDDCIKQGKKLNNNGNRNTRELLWYAIGKQDKFEKRIDEKLDQIHKEVNTHTKKATRAGIYAKLSLGAIGVLWMVLIVQQLLGY